MKKNCLTDCNSCAVIHSQNWITGYLVLARLARKHANVLREVNEQCPNMTCCPECHVDDFSHTKGCAVGDALDTEPTSEDFKALLKQMWGAQLQKRFGTDLTDVWPGISWQYKETALEVTYTFYKLSPKLDPASGGLKKI